MSTLFSLSSLSLFQARVFATNGAGRRGLLKTPLPAPLLNSGLIDWVTDDMMPRDATAAVGGVLMAPTLPRRGRTLAVDDLLSSSMVKGVLGGEGLRRFPPSLKVGEGTPLEREDSRSKEVRWTIPLLLTLPDLVFWRLLQNHTRTSSGRRSSFWEMLSIDWRLGLGFWAKNSSRTVLVCGENTALFLRFLPAIWGVMAPVEMGVGSGLSASSSHFSRMTRMVAAFAGLSCICSKRLMVLWAKLL